MITVHNKYNMSKTFVYYGNNISEPLLNDFLHQVLFIKVPSSLSSGLSHLHILSLNPTGNSQRPVHSSHAFVKDVSVQIEVNLRLLSHKIFKSISIDQCGGWSIPFCNEGEWKLTLQVCTWQPVNTTYTMHAEYDCGLLSGLCISLQIFYDKFRM